MRIWSLSAVLLLTASVVQADRYGERAALARLVHELAALEPIIREAEGQSGDGRVRFRYDWLRQDLAQIKLGIQTHISSPPPTPRTVEPLRGDYRH